MGHELEQNPETGEYSFVSGQNISAWHVLGTVMPGSLSADEVLDLAHLRGWNVRKMPVHMRLDDGTLVEVPGQFVVIRDNPFTGEPEIMGDPGGIVGRTWMPFQNEQAVGFLGEVTQTFGAAEYETAGSIENGARTFVSIHLKDFTVGGRDGIKMYLVYMVNHVTGANVCFVTNIRPVCKNTVDWGMESARFSFRHSAAIEVRHDQAREALRLAFNYDALFQAEAEKLIQEEMDLDEFRKVCDEIWVQPQPESNLPDDLKRHERAMEHWSSRRGVLKQLFVFAETQENIRFTRWGAYNAIAEYQDHVAPSGGTQANLESKAKARAIRTINGGGTVVVGGKTVAVKNKAYELLRVR